MLREELNYVQTVKQMRYAYLTSKGDWNDTFNYLNKVKDSTFEIDSILHNAGQKGVDALRNASPIDTNLMASSWGYEIEKNKKGATITWHNYDIEGGYNVAILIQYGHGTGTGGYVKGKDFINPAIESIFIDIAEEIWEEISK